MLKINKGSIVKFAYNGETRYVDVVHVDPSGIEGLDFTRCEAGSNGYRRFNISKIDISSCYIIADSTKKVYPNCVEGWMLATQLLGVADRIQIDNEEKIILVEPVGSVDSD